MVHHALAQLSWELQDQLFRCLQAICHGYLGLLSTLGVSHGETENKNCFSPTAAFHLHVNNA